MPKFNVGDWVEVNGILLSVYMREGQIIRVIPHPELPEGLNEYEVQFGFNKALLYETQLKMVSGAFDDND